jgi:hypothetical protein
VRLPPRRGVKPHCTNEAEARAQLLNPVRTPTPLQRNRRALARGPAIGRARADFGGRFDPAEWRTAAEQSDHWKRTLLPARRERPRRRRAAKQRDELAPFQLIELHSVPASQGRIAGYRIGAD